MTKENGKNMKRRMAAAVLAFICSIFASPSWAQSDTLLIQPALPDDFDRGRNISVQQRARPDYDAVGIRAGSFDFYPQLSVAGGYSDNLYYSRNDKVDGGFVVINPAFRLNSDWSRHSVQLQGGAEIRRYFSESPRNQTPWNLGAMAALDIADAIRITPELQAARQYENAFSGETTADTAILSNYLRTYAGLRSEYTAGQAKFTLSVNDTNYDFSNVETLSGTVIDQSDRDRNLVRLTGQAQYAFTPSVSVYVQAGYTDTNYDRRLLSGNDNRDSNDYRLIGGFNFDLAGLMRGTIGLGYSRRDFDSPLYRNVSGLSAEGKLEYFPSELTTVTLAVRRVVEDSSIDSSSGYFDNRALLQIDHEFLTNLIASAYGEFSRQDYIRSPLHLDVYRVGISNNYLSSNWLSFNFNLAYTSRSVNRPDLGRGFNEFSGQFGVTFKR